MGKIIKWTATELERLKQEYPEADLLMLSDELNRSVRAMTCKANELGIKRIPNNKVVSRKKFCSMCKQYHPISEFYRNESQCDGYEYYCKKYYKIKGKERAEKSKYDWTFTPSDLRLLEGDNRVAKKKAKAMVTLVDEKAGKVCSKCGEWKVLEDYYKQSSGAGGRHSKCKKCFIK